MDSVDPKVQYSLIKEMQVKTETVNMNLQVNRLLFDCFTEYRYDERT